MKMKKNKSFAKKLIIILSLSLALIVALGAATFAWLRNYVDVNTLNIESGEMLYKLTLYRVKSNGNGGYEIVSSTPLFDTSDDNKAKDPDNETFEKTLEESIIANVTKGEELFFVIEKDTKSIEIDASLSFDNLGLEGDYTNMGQVKYWICDENSAISNVSTYLANPGANTGDQMEGLSSIFHITQKTSLPDGKNIACIRLKLERPVTDGTDLNLPLRVKFCVAQKDKLPTDMNPDIYLVESVEKLNEYMGKYGVGDEIRIMGDIDYEGDLIFTRPCKLTIMHSTLTVKGNLSFAYLYDGEFELNTVSEGQIRIVKAVPDSNGERAGGNFRIDLPNAKINILGANDDELGKADIYVEEGFSANAANTPDGGISFTGMRACGIGTIATPETNGGATVYKYTYTPDNSLKPITINGPTRILTSLRTKLGPISANLYCRSITIENNGSIESINLENMVCDDTFKSAPAIFIDNAGSVGTSDTNDSNNIIRLPENSMKYIAENISSSSDNVQIKANKGSQFIRALTKNSGDSFDKPASERSKFFFSDGSMGVHDDIEYENREVFVEAVNGDQTKIVIHYQTPSAKVAANLPEFTGLKSYVDYYSGLGTIAEATQLTEVTIRCYGDKVLTSTNTTKDYDKDDYEFIRTMSKLVSLDLSDAVSTDKIVPKDAFKNMKNLTNLKMSESDTVWGQYIFTGTSVKSITFPQSLRKLDNPAYANGTAYVQNVLDGIKYVYTSVSTVEGFWYTNDIKNLKQHIFTPDEQTCAAYRNLYNIEDNDNDENWKSRIFLDNGVENHDGFFLRVNRADQTKLTCEFVTYTEDRDSTGERVAWIQNNNFNFQTIKIDGKDYTITKYDPYALYGKLVEPTAQIADMTQRNSAITILSSVTEIGERAFSNNSVGASEVGFDSITIVGDPDIRGYAFSNNPALKSFDAQNLTELYGGYNFSNNNALETFNAPRLRYVNAGGDISGCKALTDVHISVIEWTDANKTFYTSSDDYSYARFYIHTEYNDMTYADEFDKALAANSRHIFVKNSYAALYKDSGYTGVTEMGNNEISQLLWADEAGASLSKDGNKKPSYYYIVDGSNAHLVACLLSKIDKANDPDGYTTISAFDGKTVNYIGSAAYHFTAITASNITISSAVKTIGDYAFDSRGQSAKKYCITLNLNQVDFAGKGAFYYMDMAKVTGEKLTTVGKDTFSYNQSLRVVNLPKLQNSRGLEDDISTVFEYASNLRVMYVSYSVDIQYDDARSKVKNYIRFMNVVSLPDDGKPVFTTIPTKEAEASKSGVNTVMMAVNKDVEKGSYFDKAFVVINDWGLIKGSNYYSHFVDLGEIQGTIELPGYIYHQTGITGEGDNQVIELSLIASSPDIIDYGNFVGGDYITPGYLHLDGGRYTDKGNGESNVKVTNIGSYAFGAVSFNGVDEFIIADTVKTLSAFALAGSAPVYEASGNIKYPGSALSDIYTLDLSNVERVGKKACYMASMTVLKSEKVSWLGQRAFNYCTKLENVFLPSYVDADTVGYTFEGAAIKNITFGKSITSLVQYMFQSCSKLEKITILKDDAVLASCPNLVASATAGKKVFLYVPQSVLAAYKEKFKSSSGFGYIPKENFESFENATTEDGLTYYWNIIDEGAKTAYIDYIDGASFESTLDIPDTLEGYTIVFVATQAMKTLNSAVSTVELPSGMQYLTFSTADLPDTVTTLVISSDNSKFGTSEGVLYGKDASRKLMTLLVYPKAKADPTLTLTSDVTDIASGAFYGAKHLRTLNISGNVTIYDRAFENSSISTINFTKTTGVSIFAGRDIFLGVNLETLNIFVPSAQLDNYKKNVLVDYSIIDCFKAS